MEMALTQAPKRILVFKMKSQIPNMAVKRDAPPMKLAPRPLPLR